MRKRMSPIVLLSLSLLGVGCSDDENTASTQPADETNGDVETTTSTTINNCTLSTPLRIGYAADLGSLGAPSDQPGSEAAQVMIDKINEAGGVGGLPVEYVVKDIEGDPAAVQLAAQELLDDGVNALIGPRFASTGTPLLDTVDGQAPVIFMASTDPALADPSRGAFLGGFTDPVQSSAMAEWTLSQGRLTAITFSSSDDRYFSSNTEYFTTVFEEGGGTVLADYPYSLADNDFSTQVNEIAALSETPDVLFTAMEMPQMEVLLEQLDTADLGAIKVLGLDGLDATVLWTAGDTANGVYFATHTFPLETNGVAQFLADTQDAGVDSRTISFRAIAADAVQILAAAATQACSVAAADLIATIDGLQNLPVTTGTVTYAGTGGVPESDVVILSIAFGVPTFVTAFRPSNIPS
ncbi:MAG: ABC transporter substrate-binding protein [Actinomycetia bacterium]|nr:ABC transporter substrate-binding protein [Actinomycetes bacterium]